MASVGEVHSCSPAQSPTKKLQIQQVSRASGNMACMPVESEIVDSSIDDEAIEDQRPHVVALGRGADQAGNRTSCCTHHQTWCDACMRAYGITGGSLVERTRTRSLRWITDYGCLKLDGHDDDDDDEDDEVARNKLLILVAKDVKTATCLQEKGVSKYATSCLVSLLRRLGYCRAILQSDGEPPRKALKRCTSVVESVLRESPVGEHAANTCCQQ